jgi:hypothetical protein
VEQEQKAFFDKVTPGPAIIHANWIRGPIGKKNVLQSRSLWVIDKNYECPVNPIMSMYDDELIREY